MIYRVKYLFRFFSATPSYIFMKLCNFLFLTKRFSNFKNKFSEIFFGDFRELFTNYKEFKFPGTIADLTLLKFFSSEDRITLLV